MLIPSSLRFRDRVDDSITTLYVAVLRFEEMETIGSMVIIIRGN